MPTIDLLKEAGFSDTEITEHLKSAGFSDSEIKAHIEPPKMQGAPFAARHPNIYGLGGAAKETAIEVSKMLPYVKYVYPEEREKFLELDKQHQTRDLLLEDLLKVVPIGFGGKIAKDVGFVTKKYLPKTYEFFTKARSLGGIAKEGVPSEVPSIAAQETDAAKVESMYDRTLEANQKLGKTTPSQVYKAVKSKFVDTSGNIKSELLKQGDIGKTAVARHDLVAGATSKAVQDFEAVAEPLFGDLKPVEQEYLNRVIQSKRTIAIENYKDIKHPEGLGAKEHQAWLDSIPQPLAQKLNQKADTYFGVMKNQLDSLLQEGLITPEAHESLVQGGDYSPRKFLQHIDPERTFEFGGKKITVPDSGIQKLAEGSEGLLLNDSRTLLQQTITRTQNRIFRNRANKALYDVAEQIPDNGVVRSAKIIKTTKEGAPVYETAPAGHSKISTMINGQQKEMIMPNEMAKEWVTRSPEVTPQLANFIGWISGNKILKPMATGLNPEFALTNFPRDIAHIWLSTQEYSPVAPKAGLQMAGDFSKVLGDAVFRKGVWKDYINEGGGMEFLTHQGKVTSKLKGTVSSLQKILGWFGETSEITSRLMLRQRAIANGKTPEEATWIARNYLDFSQGGSWAKAVDTAVPYFNAGIQGTRGIFRAAAQKPGIFTFKIAQLGTLATGLYMANKTQNPEALAQVSDRDKVNNWIITTPFSYKDKDGTKKYVYFKVAKDQGQRVFATIFENLMAKYMGSDVNVDQITQSVQEALPITPTQPIPPSISALMGYAANKDFWKNEDIWKGPNIKEQEQYTRYTHPGFVKTGETTGLSPEKTKFALSQFFTSGNIYTSLVGYGWNKLLNQGSEQDKQLTTEEVVLKQPFIRKIAKSTDPLNQYSKSMKEINTDISTEKYMIARAADSISQKVYDGKLTKNDMKTFINSMPITERQNLWQRYIRMGSIQDLPDKRWWLEVGNMDNPEAKATAYWNKWRDSSPEIQKQMDDKVKTLQWIRGQKFYYRLNQLKRLNIKE